MNLRQLFEKLRSKTKSAVLQLFTPKEFKALILFVGLGFVVLLFRGGKELIYTLYPPATSNEYALRERHDDSLFAVLSRRVLSEDSLKFSVADDSVEFKEKTSSSSSSSKGKDLSPHSVAINKADESALVRLPGIGKVTAQRIIEYRIARGGFRNVREVMNIQGIGEKKFNQMAQYLRLD